jgi:uncharacterized protein YcfJ
MNVMRVAMCCAVILLSGCVQQPYRPIVDTGQRRGNYDDDLEDCKQVAAQTQPANNAVAGAVAGAVLGALLGRAVGLNGSQTSSVAAWGAASGGVQGLAYGSAQWTYVVNRCMSGRGYAVLN